MFGLKSAVSRVLQLHAVLRGSISLPQTPAPLASSLSRFWSSSSSFSTMSGSGSNDHALHPDANRTLTFWFSQNPQTWFRGSAAFDEEVRDKFSNLVIQARAATGVTSSESITSSSKSDDISSTNLDVESWKSTPLGSLALIIILDQFPRNLYRGSAAAFSSDPVAFDIATTAIAKGWDQNLETKFQASFMYTPLMHNESLVSQIACLELLKTLAKDCHPEHEKEEKEFLDAGGVAAATRHRDIILRFGRYPGRNKALGRENTDEEAQFLAEFPDGM